MSRSIKFLVVHCTATTQDATIEAIRNYWKNELGWRNPGYHIIVPADGKAERLAEDDRVTNGVRGHNIVSLHISYIGGVTNDGRPSDNRTPAQKQAIETQLKAWRKEYPHAIILGHRDFPGVKKVCPSFDTQEAYQFI